MKAVFNTLLYTVRVIKAEAPVDSPAATLAEAKAETLGDILGLGGGFDIRKTQGDVVAEALVDILVYRLDVAAAETLLERLGDVEDYSPVNKLADTLV